MEQNLPIDRLATNSVNRRRFLGYAGGAAGLAILGTTLAACSKDKKTNVITGDGVNLGSGDIGILNYAYALEQLEAAFYTQVCATFYAGATDKEMMLLTQIRNHEQIHREFFKAALGTNAIPALEVDFSTIDFSSRFSVLSTAQTFEDLGVAAYNGVGKLILNADYLTLAGKIVSVEARHASYIRDLLQVNNFVGDDVVSATTGLEMSKDPQTVLAAAKPFLKTKINADDLPTG